MVDRTGQNAIQALSVNGVRATAVAASSNLYKLHSGHYPFFNTHNPTESQLVTFLTNTSSGMGGLSSDVKGVLIPVTWGKLQQVQGDFTAGLAYLRTLQNACKSRGFRMALYLTSTRFGSISNQSSQGWYYIPPYLATLSGAAGGWVAVGQTNGSGIIEKRYNAVVMTEMIAFSNALAGEFNDESHFEFFITIPETEMAVTTANDPTFTEDGYLDQLERYAISIKEAWSRTIVTFGANSGFSTSARWVRLFRDIMYPNRIFRSPPDIRPTDFPPSETDVSKLGNTADAYYLGAQGGTRWVGKIGSIGKFEDPDGAKYGKVGANDPLHKGCDWVYYTSVTWLHDTHLCPTNKDYLYGSAPAANQTQWSVTSGPAAQPDPAYRWRAFYSAGGHPMVQIPPDCLPGVDTG